MRVTNIVKKAIEGAINKKAAAVNEIILALELGSSKKDLDDLLAKVTF